MLLPYYHFSLFSMWIQTLWFMISFFHILASGLQGETRLWSLCCYCSICFFEGDDKTRCFGYSFTYSSWCVNFSLLIIIFPIMGWFVFSYYPIFIYLSFFLWVFLLSVCFIFRWQSLVLSVCRNNDSGSSSSTFKSYFLDLFFFI